MFNFTTVVFDGTSPAFYLLPTYLLTYPPTYLYTYHLPTYLHTYRPTYLPSNQPTCTLTVSHRKILTSTF